MTLLTSIGALTCGIAVSACTGGGGNTSPPPPGYAGDFTLQRYLNIVPGFPPSSFLFAEAHFYTTNGDLDAGKRIVLEGPAGEQILERREFLGRILYQKDPDTDIPPSFFVPGNYAMRVPGSSRSIGVSEFELNPALTVPEAFTLTGPDCSAGLTVDGSTDVTFTWTPGNGDFVDILALVVTSAKVQEGITYRTTDDGSYTWSAAQIGFLPPGTGSLTVIRMITTDHDLPDLGEGFASGGDAVTCTLTRQ